MANVNLAPDWGQHFHDDAGNLADGWKVYTFESGTEDYKESYSEPTGTTLHNPIITLDARGEYPGQGLYLIDGEAYTLELRDNLGVVKKTVNNIFGVSGDQGEPEIILPAQTVYGNITAGSIEGYPVPIELDLDSPSSTSNIPNVQSVLDKLSDYLPNTGDNTYTGNLTIDGNIDADSISINEVDIESIFVKKDGHSNRIVVGDYTGDGVTEDIPLVNDISTGSPDEVPSAQAVKNYADQGDSSNNDYTDTQVTALNNTIEANRGKSYITDNDEDLNFLNTKIVTDGSIIKTVLNDGLDNETLELKINPEALTTTPDSFQVGSYDPTSWDNDVAIINGSETWYSPNVSIERFENDNFDSKKYTVPTDGKYLFTASGNLQWTILNTPPAIGQEVGILHQRGGLLQRKYTNTIEKDELENKFQGWAANVVIDAEAGDLIYVAALGDQHRGKYMFSGAQLSGSGTNSVIGDAPSMSRFTASNQVGESSLNEDDSANIVQGTHSIGSNSQRNLSIVNFGGTIPDNCNVNSIIGSNTLITNSSTNKIIGESNSLGGSSSQILGNSNSLTDSSEANVKGKLNLLDNSSLAVVDGNENELTDSNNSVVHGYSNNLNTTPFRIVSGYGINITASDSAEVHIGADGRTATLRQCKIHGKIIDHNNNNGLENQVLKSDSLGRLVWGDAKTSTVLQLSANYTVLDDDGTESFEVTTGATDKTVTLPTLADNIGRELTMVKVDSGGAGNAIFDGEGAETINGALTQTIIDTTTSIRIKAFNSEWRII